jgi:phosphatidylethanolamine/phosphatidyl-N-methylethanolamine N-methyltransferase
MRAYDRLATLYDLVYGPVLEPGRRAIAAAACELAPASLLAVGVGTGLTLSRYPAATRVVGIDLSKDMLRIARSRAADLSGRDISLRRMDAERMAFADGSFDCVAVPYSATSTSWATTGPCVRSCR